MRPQSLRNPIIPLIAAGAFALAAGAVEAQQLEAVEVTPSTVTAGDSVVITITLSNAGHALPTLQTLGETEALHIPAQPIPMHGIPSWSKEYTTNHFTDQTRTVQIRASLSKRTRTATLRVLPASTGGNPPPEREPTPRCETDQVFDSPSEVSQLVLFAKQNGFDFNASLVPVFGNAGDCELALAPRVRLTPKVPVGPNAFVSPPRCQARYFDGQQLKSGWDLKEASFQGGPGSPGRGHGIEWNWVKSPAMQNQPSDASFAIVTEDAVPNDYVDLAKVVLCGPRGADWHQAFDDSRRSRRRR